MRHIDPHDLPVYRQRDRILAALKDHQAVVVASPTGSGKTTQIPAILHEEGYASRLVIGVTQPRRIAAVSVSQYLARQMGATVPGVVGYKMRFEDKTDQTTRIKVMTDGILLQEIKADEFLSRYAVIMVDEAHERSLNIDFTLGLLKRVLTRRPEFRVLVSSATINTSVFSAYFDDCPVVSIDTPVFQVQVQYAPVREGPHERPGDALVAAVASAVERVARDANEGDMLVFLSGEGMIKDCMAAVSGLRIAPTLELLPLYARLAKEEQDRVFQDFGDKRKVILATNIAETSLTIDGVTTVIDSGLAKMNAYDPRTFTSSLSEVSCSKASCDQRKGRAGRTQPGSCLRLYSQSDYERRDLFTLEEIFRTDLAEVVLRMAELGIRDFEGFDFISPPDRSSIVGAVETLRALDALGEDLGLTDIGLMMVRFPIPPRLSRVIVEAIRAYPGIIQEVLTAASFLSTQSVFLLPPGEELEARRAHHRFRDDWGDLVSYLRIFDRFSTAKSREEFCRESYLDERTLHEIANVREQLGQIVSEMGVPISSGGSIEDYLCALSAGLIQFVCVRSGKGTYRSMTAERIMIHPGSVMFREDPEFIVAGEIVRTGRTYARSVSPLTRKLIARVAPELLEGRGGGRGGKRRGARDKRAEARPVSAPVSSRDFTNKIKIGHETFDIVGDRGKEKTVILPWEKLQGIAAAADGLVLASYRNMRGRITYQGFEVLSGVKLSTILSQAALLPMDRGVLAQPLPKRPLRLGSDAAEIVRWASHLAELCPAGKGSSKESGRGRKLGFVTLAEDGDGLYRVRSAKNLRTAVAESISALETLADDDQTLLDPKARQELDAAYRRLSGLLG